MNRRLIVRLEAEVDITNGAVWYDSRESGLGLELISEIHSAIGRALKNPESFTRVRRNPTVRRVLTRRFPYRIFFIVRLMHSSFSPCFTQPGTIEFGSTARNKQGNPSY
jgi:hypothetical protein